MLIAAFVILTIAVLLGTVLAVLHVQTEGRTAAPWPLAALHGFLAISGLGCLVLALRYSPRAVAQSLAAFGTMAAALIALAALIGAGLLAAHVFKKRIAGLAIGIHATLAVSGFVILAAYIFAG